MTKRTIWFVECQLMGLAFVLLWGVPQSRASTILTDNLTAASSGSDTASGSLLLAADFATDASSYILNSATLLLEQDTAGIAALYLYSNNGGIPGSLLGALSSPASYSASLTSTIFTSSGLTLAANTTYWLVLSASSGSFDWSWTTTNAGSGTGFLGDTAYYDGNYWYGASGVYPYQLSVSADPVGASATPEPTSAGLLFGGLLTLALFRWKGHFFKRFQENAQ